MMVCQFSGEKVLSLVGKSVENTHFNEKQVKAGQKGERVGHLVVKLFLFLPLNAIVKGQECYRLHSVNDCWHQPFYISWLTFVL